MDNRQLSLKELSLLRQKAVEAVVIHDLPREKVCEIFGFCMTSLRKYLKDYSQEKAQSFVYKRRGVKEGERRKLNSAQEEALVTKLLSTTPDELGMPYTLWNSKVVHEYIAEAL